jgi:hypothetical protein
MPISYRMSQSVTKILPDIMDGFVLVASILYLLCRLAVKESKALLRRKVGV